MKILEQLCKIDGIPGYEKDVSAYVSKSLSETCEYIEHDHLGSLMAYQKAENSTKTLMIASHMDEVGTMVKEVDSQGFIRIYKVGGLNPLGLLNQIMTVTLRNGTKVTGVIGTTFESKKTKDIEFDDLYLDLGMTKEEVAQLGVRPGDMVTFNGDFYCFNETKIVSKALDDRAGLWILMEVARRLKDEKRDINIAYCATVQEEVGCIGAKTCAYKVKPDLALSLDVTFSNDTPSGENNAPLGSGVCLSIIDSGTIYHQGLLHKLEEVLDKHQLPYTYEVTTGGTDSSSIQVVGEGVACMNLSIPMRYMHYSKGMIDYKDLLVIVETIVEFVKELNDQEVDKILAYRY